jgi:hypothetical protein
MARKDAEAIKQIIEWAVTNLKTVEKELLAFQLALHDLKQVHPEQAAQFQRSLEYVRQSPKFEEATAEKYDSFLASIRQQQAQYFLLEEAEELVREWKPTNGVN